MTSQATHTIKVVVDRSDAARQLDLLNRQLLGLGRSSRSFGSGLGAANDNVSRLGGNLKSANRDLGSFADGLGLGKFAALGFAAALGAMVASAIATTSKFQTLRANLVVATGSMKAAGQEFRRLQAFAAATPFTTEMAVQGFIKLKNLGLEPTERAMKSYGNTAASMGKDMMQMVEAVADATTGEFERLKEFGIKAKQNKDSIAFTFAGVTTTVAKNSQEIQRYLINLGETRFGEAMELQAKTFSGVMSTLSDNLDVLLDKMGQGFAEGVYKAADSMQRGANGAENLAVAFGRLGGQTLGALVTGLEFVGRNMEIIVGVMAARLIPTLVATIRTTYTAVAAEGAHTLALVQRTAALYGVTQAQAALAVSTRALSGLLGGLLIGAVAAGLYLWIDATTKAHQFTEQLNTKLEDETKNLAILADALQHSTTQQNALTSAVNGAISPLNSVMAAYNNAAAAARGLAVSARAARIEMVKKEIAEVGSTRRQTKREGVLATAGAALGIPNHDYFSEREGREETIRTLNTYEKSLRAELEGLRGTSDEDYAAALARAAAVTDTPTSTTTPTGTKPKKAGAGFDAAKAWKDYIKNLEDARDAAGLLGEAQAILLAQQAASQAIHGTLSDQQKATIAGLIEETERRKALAAVDQRLLEIEQKRWAKRPMGGANYSEGEIVVTGAKAKPMSLAEMEIQQQIEEARVEAVKGIAEQEKAVAFWASAEWQEREKALKTSLEQEQSDARRAEQVKRLKGILESTPDFAGDYERGRSRLADVRAYGGAKEGSLAYALVDATKQIDAELRGAANQLEIAQNNTEFSAKEVREIERDIVDLENERAGIVRETTAEFARTMLQTVDSLSQSLKEALGDKAGGAVGGLLSVFTMFKTMGSIDPATGKSSYTPGTIGAQSNSPFAKVFTGLKDLNSQMGDLFGKQGGFFKGLDKTLGKMGDGAAVGSAIAPVGKAIWSKFSTTGAQIGGAIGSVLPIPGGQIIGSIIGGTIGGLFKKTKKASQGFNFDADGKLVLGSLSGNSSKYKGAVSQAGNSVISSLYDIAAKLGGNLQSVNMASIGIRKDKWVVDPSGRGNTKHGVIKFGKDGESDAIAYVIKDALKKGVITGLSAFATRIVRTGEDAMIDLAAKYESMLRDLETLKDPLGGALKQINSSMDDMVKAMKSAGATAEELAKAEEYRALKIKELYQDQLDTLRDFKKALSGEGSGVTSLNRLRADLAEFDAMRADIAAGKLVDQEKFTSLGQEIFGLAGDVYGTSTSAFQSIRSMLMEATQGAIDNVQTAVDSATVTAINQQTAQVVAQQGITNDLLRNQNELLAQYLGSKMGIAPASVTRVY